MKKTFTLLLAILILSSCLVSFDDVGNDITTQDQDITIQEGNNLILDPIDIKLDPDKSPLPSYFALKEIKKGMTYKEVYEIAGLPQRMGEKVLTFGICNPIPTYIYDTRWGISIEIILGIRYNNYDEKTKDDDDVRGEFVVSHVFVNYPENGEFIVLAIIILFIILFPATAVFIIRKKKKRAIAATNSQAEQTA